MNQKTFVNAALILILFLGLGLAIYGGYLYIDSTQGISDNAFAQARDAQDSGEPLEVPDDSAEMAIFGQTMFESQQEYNDLKKQQSDSIRFAGVGIALIGVAWIGRDFIVGRRNRIVVEEIPSTMS